MSAAMDVVTLQFLLAELKIVRAEQMGDLIQTSKEVDVIGDNSILGNSDRMLFYSKELLATAEDPSMI